ncbi:50S ribosomal protein L29 [Candidatus Riesia pediculischaeffi]
MHFLSKNENFKNSSVFKKIRKKIARIRTFLNKKKEKNEDK